MTNPLVVTSEPEVKQRLSYAELIPAMREALIDLSAGRVQQPVRTVIPVSKHNGWMGVMPAVYRGVCGAKLVTFYPGNGARGIPTHMAMILLFRAETGEPIAVLDGRLITEMRTAAVSAVATEALSRQDSCVLAVLGSGVQCRSHIEALRMVRSLDEIRVWSPDAARCRACAEEVGAVAALSADAAVRDADIVVTVTSAAEPVLQGKWLKPGAYVNAVGAVGPRRRELDAEAMDATVIVESREAALIESGDILIAGASIDAELGEVLAGKFTPTPGRRVVFKSLGVAVEDLAAALLVTPGAMRPSVISN
jgi:thiomorpholine-carboxylate dehydrogenase